MKKIFFWLVIFSVVFMSSCVHNGYNGSIHKDASCNVLFLHHSTGNAIYNGLKKGNESDIKQWFVKYNSDTGNRINFVEQIFPKSNILRYFPGYGWNNYPYDYYNIWVKNGNKRSYKNEPTLKTLCPLWDVIVFKHCFPVSNIKEDESEGNIDSDIKSIPNYKLQYNALKAEMLKYPDTKFILWTGATLTQKETEESRAIRAKDFFTWVKEVWDEPDDNIFLWDFYDLETEGELYMKQEYASGDNNSHPNKEFSAKVAPLLCQRVVDVELNNGSKTDLHGCYIEKAEE